jgi:hypothetical protein
MIRARLRTWCGCSDTMNVDRVLPYIERAIYPDIDSVVVTGAAVPADVRFEVRRFLFVRMLSEYDAEYLEEYKAPRD